MSQQIKTAFVNQFSANIELLAQQIGSRLEKFVTIDPQGAEYGYFDQIGAVEAQEKTSRHADLVVQDTPHSRRRVAMKDWYCADYVDRADKLRLLKDPSSEYVQNFAASLNRQKDLSIITAATATAYTGKDGSTATAFATATQQIAVDYVESGSATDSNLTIAKLREARRILNSNEAIMDGEPVVFVMGSSQEASLLATTEATSSDYNTVKALVNGQINTFMGFEFVRSEQLAVSSSVRTCLAFPKSAIKMAMGQDIGASVDEVATKGKGTFLVQAFMTLGATRMQEKKVVSILCDES